MGDPAELFGVLITTVFDALRYWLLRDDVNAEARRKVAERWRRRDNGDARC